MTSTEIFEQRKNKFLKIGRNKGFINNLENLSSVEFKRNKLKEFFKKKENIFYLIGSLLLLGLLTIYL